MAGTHQHISVAHRDDVLVLTILLPQITDYVLAEDMGRELFAAAAQEPAAGVIVDMGNIQYMSSVGYGPLVSLRSRVRHAGGRLVLCNLSGIVKEMFEATRLLINPHSPKSLFEYADTLAGALQMLG